MKRMLVHSDNRATDILLNDLGGPRAVHDWLQDNGVTGLRVDRNIADLLRAKRDLWDRRDSSTPVAMVDLLKRIYKAELIKPESRNYLLDLMAQCQTGKNRMRALLPFGTVVEHKTGTLDGLTDDIGFISLPDGRRVAVAIFARGGADRPRTIAETARAIYDGFKSVFAWPFGAPAYQKVGAAPHRCAREDRPLSGGRAGRPLSEAHRLADAGDRTARPRRQAARPAANSVSIVLDERGARYRRSSWRGSSRRGATAASARRAS